MTAPGSAVLGVDNVLFAVAEVSDARALSTVDEPFRVATGWTVEVTDPWGNVVGFIDCTEMPARGRLA
jgi:hypothetical protein